MRYTHKKDIETGFERRYREDKKAFWFSDEQYMYCTQQKFDEYCNQVRKGLRDKKPKTDAKIFFDKLDLAKKRLNSQIIIPTINLRKLCDII